jgi:hypothetical protein
MIELSVENTFSCLINVFVLLECRTRLCATCTLFIAISGAYFMHDLELRTKLTICCISVSDMLLLRGTSKGKA